jgi:succinoglycan biosynthesis transport protein ExoP
VELRRYLHLFRQRWPLIAACVVVGALVGFAVTPKTDRYSATARIYVGTRLLAQNQNELYAEPGLNEVIATLAEMIPSAGIARQAITSTGVDRSVGTVISETKASVVTGTTLIDVTVTDTDPGVAQKLADGVSEAFANQANTDVVGSTAGPGSVPFEPAYVFQEAARPSSPVGTGFARKVSLGGVLGLIVAVLIVLLLDYLDVTIRSPGDIQNRLGLPVLGVVPFRSSAATKPSVAAVRSETGVV